MLACMVEHAVDLITDHQNAVASHHTGQRLQFSFAIGGAAGVAGVVQHQNQRQLRLLALEAELLQLLGAQSPMTFCCSLQSMYRMTGQVRLRFIGNPTGRNQQHFGASKRRHHCIDQQLAARTYQYPLSLPVHTILFSMKCGYRFTQRLQPLYRQVGFFCGVLAQACRHPRRHRKG